MPSDPSATSPSDDEVTAESGDAGAPGATSAVTRVHLVRHGEVHNPEGVLYGRMTGYRLAARGEQMAQRVADYFAGGGGGERHDVALVTSSPLERARQTAAPIAARFGLMVGIDPDLIEAENRFEGLTIGAGRGRLSRPEHWYHLRNPLRPSWGEPYRHQVERMMRAIRRARAAAAGREAVLVSHQLPIWVTRLHLEGRRLPHDPRRRECTLASVTTLTFDGSTLTRVAYTEPAGDLLPSGPVVPGA
jgi:broad specificity phosphatase PhoE